MIPTVLQSASLQTPVLFLVFNRPDTTARVFEAIRQAKPPRLYVAGDGPRSQNEGEAERVARVRAIATAVDWPCEVKTLFQEKNLGCKHAVGGAITWFFEQEEEGIILEDDCLPSISFFWFCENMLIRFKNDNRVMAITGTNVAGQGNQVESYSFSNFALMWGWASWARAWANYDKNLKTWPKLRSKSVLLRVSKNFSFLITWYFILCRTFEGFFDTWDYQWIFSCWSKKGLTVVPRTNLIVNIGFSDEATHTKTMPLGLKNTTLGEMNFPLIDCNDIKSNDAYDRNVSRFWFGATTGNIFKSFFNYVTAKKNEPFLVKNWGTISLARVVRLALGNLWRRLNQSKKRSNDCQA